MLADGQRGAGLDEVAAHRLAVHGVAQGFSPAREGVAQGFSPAL